MVAQFAELLQLSPAVLVAVGGLFVALASGSLARAIGIWVWPTHHRRQRVDSLKTWWVLAFLFGCSVLLGRFTALLFVAAGSCLALREFLELTVPDRRERRELWFLHLAAPLHYASVYAGGSSADRLAVLLVFLLLLPARHVAAGSAEAFIRRVAVPSWGLLFLVFFPSHAAFLYSLPETANRIAGGAGWFLYLLALTEICDISQALWGRAVGRHKIGSAISPHKTWEGFLLGTLTTTVLAAAAAPYLTSLTYASSYPHGIGALGSLLPAVLAGLLISVAALFGDLTMSAVKRDVGVKDSGSLLPGIGGVLDRIDSLTFTAPAFFYYVAWLYSEDGFVA